MTERKLILKEVTTLDIDGYLLKDVVKNLTELLAEYGPDAQVSEEQHQYQDGRYMALLRPTPETDAEMAQRINQEAINAARRERIERQEFERLQAKFGAR